MRKWRVGDFVRFSIQVELPGVGAADKEQHGTISRMSPCGRHCVVCVDDDTEILTEVSVLKVPREV